MEVGEGSLEEIRDAREMEGEPGREEMREASEVVSNEGDEVVTDDNGGGTGIGIMVTSVIGSAGSEVTISRYLSWSKGGIDRNIGEKTGCNNAAGRHVMYEWKPWRWRVFKVQRTRSLVTRIRAWSGSGVEEE